MTYLTNWNIRLPSNPYKSQLKVLYEVSLPQLTPFNLQLAPTRNNDIILSVHLHRQLLSDIVIKNFSGLQKTAG